MTDFEINHNYEQSHNIVRGFQEDNQLAFDKASGRFVVLHTAAEKSEAKDKYVTDPKEINKLVLEYLDVNPEYVDSKRIIKTLKQRTQQAGKSSKVLQDLAERVEARYEMRLKRGSVLEVSGTQKLVTDTGPNPQEMLFRTECQKILGGLAGRFRLIVNEKGELEKVPKDDPRSSSEDEIIAAYQRFLSRNDQFERAISELSDRLSRSPSPLGRALGSVTPSTATASPIPEESVPKAIFDQAAMRRQLNEITRGFGKGMQLIYNEELGNFIAIKGTPPQKANLMTEKAEVFRKLYAFLAAIPAPLQKEFKNSIRKSENPDARSCALYLETLKPIKSKEDALVSVIALGMQDGWSLYYNPDTEELKALDPQIAVGQTDEEREDAFGGVIVAVSDMTNDQLTALKAKLKNNQNEDSNELIKDIDIKLRARIPGEYVSVEFVDLEAAFNQGTQPGYQLVYNTVAASFIPLRMSAVEKLEESDTLITNPKEVLQALYATIEDVEHSRTAEFLERIQNAIDEIE